MTDIIAQLDRIKWHYADADPVAKAALEHRIATAGRAGKLITYSDLVQGVTFRLPTVNGGATFQIDTSDWRDLDRAIIGEFLGLISADSYRAAGFFASALVIGKDTPQPSGQFFKWMRELGLIKGRSDETATLFWSDEVAKAQAWYASNSDPT